MSGHSSTITITIAIYLMGRFWACLTYYARKECTTCNLEAALYVT